MKTARMISWNVNGLRAVHNKGALQWFREEEPDILCLQETKAMPDQVPKELKEMQGYHVVFESAQRKGYSGVALYAKQQPRIIDTRIGPEQFNIEGRIIMAEFETFLLFNIYFPNGAASKERLDYKMGFYDAFLAFAEKKRKKHKAIVICGDFNTAHKEIDLARPKENEGVSGFLPQERAWLDKLVRHGYVDTFRETCKEDGHYSWWDYKTRARERNVGWRIDYFFVTKEMLPRVKSARILSEIMGSDHCPIELTALA